MPQWIQNLFTAVMYLVMVAVGTAVLRAIYQSVKNAGKAFSEDEEDEVLFLHQGNDERENLPWRREKKEGYLSPNMRIRRKYKKRSKKPENTSRPEPKPRRSWKRETSFPATA